MHCPEHELKSPIAKSLSLTIALIFSVNANAASVETKPAELTEADYFADIPVVLSATRLQQPIDETPVAMSIIDREMIEASGFTEIPDLLRLVPGFHVSYDSGHIVAAGYHMLHDRYVRHQQILIDGRSVYSPLLGGINWSELPIVIDDIERIEVVRGPNASTYGSNSFLGVINIITRHASQDDGHFIKANAGTNNYVDGVYRFGDNIGNLDYRVSVNYRQDDGFENRYDGKNVRVITTRGDYLYDNKNNFSFQAGYSEGPREEDNAIAIGVPNHQKNTKTQFQQLSWRHTPSNTDEYQVQLYHNLEDLNQTYPGVDFSARTDRTELEFQHRFNPYSDLRLVWGASARTDKVASVFFMGTPDYVKNNIYRVFINTEYQLTSDTLINAGLMYEDNDTAGSDLLPRLSFNHQVDSNNHLRIAVSKATRAPVLFEEDPYYAGLFSGVIDLEPERITSYEIGYIASSSDKSITADTRIYYDDIDGLIGLSFNGSQFYYDNFDHANIRGLETSLTFNLSRDTRFITNYSYTNINSTKNTNDSEYDIAFPKNLINVLVMHNFSSQYKGSLGFYHRSSTKPLAKRAADPDVIPSYQRFDLRLARSFKLNETNSELSITIQNLFDHVPVTRLNNFPGRQAYISWKMNFK